jgi:hypothetical protein
METQCEAIDGRERRGAGQRAAGLHGDDGGASRRRCARALTRLAVQATDMPGGVGTQEAGEMV